MVVSFVLVFRLKLTQKHPEFCFGLRSLFGFPFSWQAAICCLPSFPLAWHLTGGPVKTVFKMPHRAMLEKGCFSWPIHSTGEILSFFSRQILSHRPAGSPGFDSEAGGSSERGKGKRRDPGCNRWIPPLFSTCFLGEGVPLLHAAKQKSSDANLFFFPMEVRWAFEGCALSPSTNSLVAEVRGLSDMLATQSLRGVRRWNPVSFFRWGKTCWRA